jgi:hypothetical protein
MNLTKRMQKRAAHVLEPGEHYIGALSVGPPGATAYSANPGGAVGAVGAFARATEEAAADPGVWLDVPMEGFILGLTNRRLPIFDQSFLGMPQELLVEVPQPSSPSRSTTRRPGPSGAPARTTCAPTRVSTSRSRRTRAARRPSAPTASKRRGRRPPTHPEPTPRSRYP